MNKIVKEIAEIISLQRKTLKSQNKPIPTDDRQPSRLMSLVFLMFFGDRQPSRSAF